MLTESGGQGWPVPPPPNPDALKPRAASALGPQPGRVAGGPEEKGLSWALHSDEPCSRSPPPRPPLTISTKKYSPSIFTMSVIFLFYIGKENFLDTRPFRETL